jgi:hypothetical protein
MVRTAVNLIASTKRLWDGLGLFVGVSNMVGVAGGADIARTDG